MKKRKLKKIWIIIPIIIVVLLAYPTYLTVKIVSHNYEFSSVFDIVTKGLTDTATNNKYSKTLEVAIKSKNFNKDNANSYLEINYHDKKDFIDSINKLLALGYSVSDINMINDKLNDNTIEALYKHELIKDISKYMEFDYFKSDNLYRYLAYYAGYYKETVVYVNIGLDKKLYEDADVITKFDETVLANKYHKLDENFVPDNLVQIKDSCAKNKSYLSKVAQVAFENMCDAAREDGKNILSNSAYRSYKNQQDVYDTYLNLYGQTYVDNYVAVPGFSEHQTGLALDVAAKGYNTFKKSPEYTWMLENAYKYGFILRYPKEKQDITGYKNEAWHFRYVGLEAAKYIQENNITYEEYYVMFLDK